MTNHSKDAVHTHPVVAIYPGSFDPLTNGHLDLISRGAKLFDRLIVAILGNSKKAPLFTIAERTEMLAEATAAFPNVEIDSFEGLLVEYAARRNAKLILRGIRAISDYELEWQMALMNRRLRPETETIFLMAGEAFSFVSSHLVKEVVSLDGDVSGLVPRTVDEQLRKKMLLRKGQPAS